MDLQKDMVVFLLSMLEGGSSTYSKVASQSIVIMCLLMTMVPLQFRHRRERNYWKADGGYVGGIIGQCEEDSQVL